MNYQKIRKFLTGILSWLTAFLIVTGIFLFFTGMASHNEMEWKLGIFCFLYAGIFTAVWSGLRKRIRDFELIQLKRRTPIVWRRRRW